MDSANVITIYEPNDSEIEQVSLQLPESASREDILSALKRTNGNISEAILIILTNDNVIPKQTSTIRQYPKPEITLWNKFFDEVEQYKKDNNITGLQNRNVNDPLIQTSIEFEEKN